MDFVVVDGVVGVCVVDFEVDVVVVYVVVVL